MTLPLSTWANEQMDCMAWNRVPISLSYLLDQVFYTWDDKTIVVFGFSVNQSPSVPRSTQMEVGTLASPNITSEKA